MNEIRMVDLRGQYQRLKSEIDAAIQEVLNETDFIQGKAVRNFEEQLSDFLGGTHVISCANGTDALQLAMMALGFKPGDEIILPVHTYVATAEVIALLQLVPVFVDVDERSFTIDIDAIERKVTSRTVAIVPVHLYGQCAEMEGLLAVAERHGLRVIEDTAQALGADFIQSNGAARKAGTLGHVGTTSFFPSKNLGGFGDGGALMTSDADLASRLRMMANHGQAQKYKHDVIGVNSRLDTLQAAILRAKLRHLSDFTSRRQAVANYYDRALKSVDFLRTPWRVPYSTHVYHQYTVQTVGIDRDVFKDYLQQHGIPSMIYYPIPLHLQKAYRQERFGEGSFPVTERLSKTVLSLPIHTEMDKTQLSYICETIRKFH
jgi:dTDP-4-amino-4,6-dideoxygalactose transaminase